MLSGAICRVASGLLGAAVMVRRRAPPKDVLAAYRLLSIRHMEDVTVDLAISVVEKARQHALEPLDLLLIFDSYCCSDLEEAVTKTLEMKALFKNPFAEA